MSHPCVLCGSKTNAFKHPRFHMLFHACPSCGLIAKDASLFIESSEEVNIYLTHQNSLDNIGYVNYLTNFIEQAVKPYLKEGHILDYGSGPEPVLAHLLSTVFHYHVDIYDIYFAKERVYTDQSYDLITSTEVIEHIQNPTEIFKFFHSHLKKGGILSIMTLFYPTDQEAFFNWFYIRDKSHVTFYAPKTMTYIAKHFGFELLFHNDHRITVFKKHH